VRVSKDHRSPSAWAGTIPLQSHYTAGSGGQIFFQALKQRGKLVGTRCAPCGQVYLPARSFCERCLGELTEQVEIEPAGRIVSFTVCYADRDRAPMRRPQALALVQLEGATTVLLHYLIGFSDPSDLEIGSRVEIIIKPKKQRIGSILDIEGFRLLQRS
jgi:uncharacterized OB-fold protein